MHLLYFSEATLIYTLTHGKALLIRMLSKRKLLSQIFQIFGPYNGKMDTANTSLGNSDVPLTWAEPGRVPVTGPAIHASTGPATQWRV